MPTHRTRIGELQSVFPGYLDLRTLASAYLALPAAGIAIDLEASEHGVEHEDIMKPPIICGNPATRLSETVDYVDIGHGVYMYIVAEISGPFSEREEAFKTAREWFPALEDDENSDV